MEELSYHAGLAFIVDAAFHLFDVGIISLSAAAFWISADKTSTRFIGADRTKNVRRLGPWTQCIFSVVFSL